MPPGPCSPQVQVEKSAPCKDKQLVQWRIKHKHSSSLVPEVRNNERSLLQQLNILQSGLGKLPPEILSHIFFFASSPVGTTSQDIRRYFDDRDWPNDDTNDPDSRIENNGPIHLSSVCSLWYHIAKSTPQLWSSLALDLKRPEMVSAKISLLQLYLENSRSVPFSLVLNFTTKLPIYAVDNQADSRHYTVYNPTGVALFKPLYKIIFSTPKNSCRIRVLHISQPPLAWSSLSFKDFLILEELCLQGNGTPVQVVNGLHSPHLTRLILRGEILQLNPHDLPHTSNLTVIHLLRANYIYCFSLLRCSPNLVEYRAEDIVDYGFSQSDQTAALPSSYFTLSQLEVFEWSGLVFEPRCTWNEAVLQFACFPVLRVCCWGLFYSRDNSGFNVLFQGFCERLPKSLVELELLNLQGNDLESSLSRLTSVRKLFFRGYPLDQVARFLTSRVANDGFFPALEEIRVIRKRYWWFMRKRELRGGKSPEDGDKAMQRVLKHLVDKRWPNPAGHKLRFSTINEFIFWESRTDDWYNDLLGRGFELEVYENGRRLMPLYDGMTGSLLAQ